MDNGRALKLVEEFLELLDENHDAYNRFAGSSSVANYDVMRESNKRVRSRLEAVYAIGDEAVPNFARSAPLATRGWEFVLLEERTLYLSGVLRDAEELAEIIGVAGPKLAAANLHPIVWDAAARLWEGDHYRQAVESAATAVDDSLRAKLGRSDIRGSALVAQAFSKDDPSPGQPRLRFIDIDPKDRQAWTDAHIGTMHFGIGCMMAIRNVVAHDSNDLDPQVALEQLAALSVFARKIDAALVIVAP